MIKAFSYQGVAYTSEKDVRKALYESKRLALGKAPNENVAEFWAKYGVTYSEEDDSIETLKQQKRMLIKHQFLNWRNNKATLVSSLNFKADSNERAMSDVNGLLVAYEDNQGVSITFRDADNAFRLLSYSQLKTLQKEIIENGNFAYSQKWTLDTQVENATTKEDIDVIEVKFEGKNFLEVSNDAE